jgi:dTDP-4-amino-4,6-dideoxygalactose transaminase
MPVTAGRSVPFHKAVIEEEEIQAVVEVLRSGWLTTGSRVKKFEAEFADYVGAAHAVAVNSCTAALHVALSAVGLTEGEEVIVPTMTFAATGEVVQYFKARPVLIDCEADSFQLAPSEMERAITSQTRAIIPVHHSGAPADMGQILDVARRHGLKVVEDAAHALPAEYRGRRIGTLGDITCFSFYATKTITTGEGGMATTENSDYAERMRILSLHGISKDAYKRYTREGTWRYEILETGFKYNMTDLQGALGLAQLAKCDDFRARRHRIARRYEHGLSQMDAFETPQPPIGAQHSWHLYVLRLNLDTLRIDRDRMIDELGNRGITASVHFIPLHLHPHYQKQLRYRLGQFPNAERHFERAISLPIYPSMSDEDVDYVIEILRELAHTFRK